MHRKMVLIMHQIPIQASTSQLRVRKKMGASMKALAPTQPSVWLDLVPRTQQAMLILETTTRNTTHSMARQMITRPGVWLGLSLMSFGRVCSMALYQRTGKKIGKPRSRMVKPRTRLQSNPQRVTLKNPKTAFSILGLESVIIFESRWLNGSV